MRLSKPLLAAVLAVLGSPGFPQETPRFLTTSNVVLVDVRVLDSEGRPVKGLTVEDFSIEEEGIPQAISFFQEISIPLPAEGTPTGFEAETTEEQDQGAAGSEQDLFVGLQVPEKRVLILLFNLSSMNPQDSAFVREAAREFLLEDFTAYDSAAIAVFDQSLYLLSDLTSQKEELLAALNSLGQVNPESEVSLPSEDEDADSEAFIADETEFALFQTNQQLAAVESLAEAFKDIAGRKSIIYFTPGLAADAIENVEQMRITTDFANRTNTSLYTVDSRGLVALSPGGGAQSRGGRGTSIFTGRSSLNQLASLAQSQEGLVTLAVDTGGYALLDDNDLGRIFRIAQEESSHYYLLAYRVLDVPKDGRYRRIQVSVANPAFELTYRRGYYADKPYLALSSQEREERLRRAVIQEEPAADFRLETSAAYFPQLSGTYLVSVFLSFDYGELRRLGEAENLNLEIIILARDGFHRVLGGLRDQLEIKPRGTDEPRFLYQNLLQLPVGEYEITALVRENRRGHLSKAVSTLGIDPGGELRMSSLVLGESRKETEAQDAFRVRTGKTVTVLNNPLEVGGRILLPRFPAVFYSGDEVYFHGKVFSSEGVQPAEFRIALKGAEGQDLVTSPWMDLRESPKFPGIREYSGKFGLSGLVPASYELQVEVRGEGVSGSRSTPLVVVSRPREYRPGAEAEAGS